MKIAIVCLVVALVCSCKQNSSIPATDVGAMKRQKEVRKILSNDLGRGIGVLKGPLSISEGKDIDMVYRNGIVIDGRWKELMTMFKPGDEVYYYKTDLKSWGELIGAEGYVLIRGDEAVKWVTTTIN